MKQVVLLVLVVAMLAGMVFLLQTPDSGPERAGAVAVTAVDTPLDPGAAPPPPLPDEAERVVLDVSVNNLEELKVLLDRAGQFATKPRAAGEDPAIVLVLHGPEVQFFSISNYDQYRDIVDQAARLDAFDVVDVRMCQGMMDSYGLQPEDIPSFIEVVPFGPAEVERLVRDGYVYF